ncbi:hypothetical protein CANINC_003726 [Pichia inconspicua]|uniref:Alpha-1,2-mannosyltransferase n=1 Tax=Pichia inconspicua TaxID=52247 RepID=A0A4T0WY03_9ASCO|nr:hypothetical protein CANINC_003726 [[Candida] inconspicua]
MAMSSLIRSFQRRPGYAYAAASLIIVILYILFTQYSLDSGYSSKSAIIDANQRKNYLFPQKFDDETSSDSTKRLNKAVRSKNDAHNSRLIKEYFLELAKFHVSDKVLDDPENQLEFTDAAASHNLITLQYLQSKVNIPKKWIEEVKSKHQQVSQFLKDRIAIINKSSKTQEQNAAADLMFRASGNGAVMIGGADNDDTWLALISTRLFRKAGGILPVEVMLPTKKDYEKDREICDKYLPQLNARCVIIEDLLNMELSSNVEEREFVHKYIWSNFNNVKREIAILLSSFENVLYLTPQNVMLKPMENDVFEKQLYKDNGFFIWNDYGLRHTLSAFYEVSEIKIGNFKGKEFGLPLTEELIKESKELTPDMIRTQVNFHDLANTLPAKQNDASELIINKRKHLTTLLLSLYYNLNGEKVYYILLTGSPNDIYASKETLTAAAHALENSYYSINTDVDTNGYWYDNEFHGVSMLQYDPIVDSYSYDAYMTKFGHRKGKTTWSNYQKWLQASSERRSPMFLNIFNPSLKPIELIKKNIVKKDNGDRVRLISDTPYFGGEFESSIWRVMNDYICYLNLECEYVNKHFGTRDDNARKEFCESEMKEHLMWIAN